MSIPSSDDLRVWLKQLVASNTFLQVAPFAVLFLFPLIVLRLIQPAQQLVFLVTNTVVMVLESIGILPWNWGRSNSSPSSSRSPDKRKSKKKHHPRTRAEQLAMNKSENETDDDADYYPGLVNISGTYCFMNSTLQAMASLSYLQPQIDTIHEKAVELDVPSPVIDALRDLFDGRAEYTTDPLIIPTPPSNHSSSLRLEE
ncbi:hypothetical protein ONZ45_g14147 [Pleurotus djamor]|nr:hypothetical protein ONZ45_g14147 [Pleurotus djamor]